jgi:phosphohistidine phosphatase SixA
MLRLLFILTLFISGTANANLVEDLRSGSSLIIMRHADSPGFSDPQGYRLNDCSSQRNLGDYGRKQASEIGQWLAAQGIKEARVFSSPWCRCMDTATLLNKGKAVPESSLGSFFEEMSRGDKQTRELEAFIQKQLSSSNKAPLILVSHQVNIRALTGVSVGSGQMLLVKVNKQGQAIDQRPIP